MSTTTTTSTNPLSIGGLRSGPGRLIAVAGGLAAVIGCTIALVAGAGSQDTARPPASAAQGVPDVRPGSDPSILHHHWLNTAKPATSEQIRRTAERFHHR